MNVQRPCKCLFDKQIWITEWGTVCVTSKIIYIKNACQVLVSPYVPWCVQRMHLCCYVSSRLGSLAVSHDATFASYYIMLGLVGLALVPLPERWTSRLCWAIQCFAVQHCVFTRFKLWVFMCCIRLRRIIKHCLILGSPLFGTHF
jgi:hypothetical protein